MTSVQNQEDLEARIARIKKRNEEIEQKYREAEEDRLRAMKENAMVEIKPPKDDDWPREHKYDKIDFNYDLDPETLAQLEEKKKEKDAFIQKIAKDYKVFAEGEGPPPDPAYSFLADVERDGEKAAAAAAANNNGNNGTNGNSSAQLASPNGRSPPASKGGDHFDRRNPNNRSGHRQGPRDPGGPQQGGRPRVGSGKSSHHHGGHHSHHHHGGPNIQRSFSTNEHDGWRSASGEQQRRNGKIGTAGMHEGAGLWRREQYDGSEGKSKDDSSLQSSAKLEPNLTVSVSRDGEFKSVKVTTPPIIGSGRVGPRQAAKPQFQFHTGPGEHNHHNHHHSGGGHQHSHGHGHHPLPLTAGGRKELQHGSRDSAGTHSVDHFNRNVTGRKSDRGGESAKKHTGGGGGGGKGPFSGSSLQNGKGGSTAGGGGPGSSVQDRLNRNRLVASSDRNDNITKTRVETQHNVLRWSLHVTYAPPNHMMLTYQHQHHHHHYYHNQRPLRLVLFLVARISTPFCYWEG
ncbi:AGAP009071-PA-like protein [Anopheles sinensis]|uniref:AGAP009071-PA-like protein n=1 Tax=Anopheles sinensis TaxID=74873 RepID=A0A084VY65_ANOSI|nr:AGAP009071-PA-like protein [Anopheles sinensis]